MCLTAPLHFVPRNLRCQRLAAVPVLSRAASRPSSKSVPTVMFHETCLPMHKRYSTVNTSVCRTDLHSTIQSKVFGESHRLICRSASEVVTGKPQLSCAFHVSHCRTGSSLPWSGHPSRGDLAALQRQSRANKVCPPACRGLNHRAS